MIAEKVAEVRREWGWFLTLGIVLTLLSVAAIYYDATATFVSVVVLGAFLLLGGLAQVIIAFLGSRRRARHPLPAAGGL